MRWLVAISRRTRRTRWAVGLEGIDEPDEQALYVNPYDAGAASEGTQDRYQRMVSRRRFTAPGQHRPWTAPRQSPSSTAWRRKHRNPGQGWANAKREAMANGSEEWFYSTNDNSSLNGTAWPNQRKKERESSTEQCWAGAICQ